MMKTKATPAIEAPAMMARRSWVEVPEGSEEFDRVVGIAVTI